MPRVPGDRLHLDDDVWTEEVDRFAPTSAARRQASAARRAIERPSSTVPLRACAAAGEDNTRLAGCAKVYVPLDAEPSRAPYGFVFMLDVRGGRPIARLLAYGERHPTRGRTVYERAHRRLHGRYPNEE